MSEITGTEAAAVVADLATAHGTMLEPERIAFYCERLQAGGYEVSYVRRAALAWTEHGKPRFPHLSELVDYIRAEARADRLRVAPAELCPTPVTAEKMAEMRRASGVGILQRLPGEVAT